ncbi:MAG TPA: hypothetical protein VNL16_19920 [Chloroflexota bacterium]|nr:hypothetical protein [Chloroflexota bacterium]
MNLAASWGGRLKTIRFSGSGVPPRREIREEAQIAPGDTLNIHVVAPGKLVIEVVRRMAIEEFFDKYHIEGLIDLARIRDDWHEEAAGRAIGDWK